MKTQGRRTSKNVIDKRGSTRRSRRSSTPKQVPQSIKNKAKYDAYIKARADYVQQVGGDESIHALMSNHPRAQSEMRKKRYALALKELSRLSKGK
jgi:predicted transcriptional regulator